MEFNATLRSVEALRICCGVCGEEGQAAPGTQFTCLTSTNTDAEAGTEVQMLMQKLCPGERARPRSGGACYNSGLEH
jgi:hypothetical protein